MNGFIAAFIVAGGISLCIAAFTKKGLPLSNDRRITGRPAKVVGMIALVVSLAV